MPEELTPPEPAPMPEPEPEPEPVVEEPAEQADSDASPQLAFESPSRGALHTYRVQCDNHPALIGTAVDESEALQLYLHHLGVTDRCVHHRVTRID